MTEINICLNCNAPPCSGAIRPGCPLRQHRQAHRSASHFDGCGCTKCVTVRKLEEARRRWDGTPMTLTEFAAFSGVNVSTIRSKVYAGALKSKRLPRIKPTGGQGAPVLYVTGV